MTPRSSYVLVGVFVLVLGALLIAGLLWLTTGGPPKDYDGYLVYMTDSVSGLNVDAEVKYKGVNVGRVSDIRLDPANPERVRIALLVLEDTPVKRDTVATLELLGITGIATINLSGGSRDSAALITPEGEEYPVIQSRPSLLVRLDDTVSELLASLISTSDRISNVLAPENQLAIAGILENTQELSGRLTSRADELAEVLTGTNRLLDRLDGATADLPALLAQLTSAAGALEQMAGNLADAAIAMEATSKDLQHTVVQSGADVRSFTSGTLPQASELLIELRETASNLRSISESLESDPSQVLFGAPPPEPGPGEAQ